MFSFARRSFGCLLFLIGAIIALIAIIILVNILINVDYMAIKRDFFEIVNRLVDKLN